MKISMFCTTTYKSRLFICTYNKPGRHCHKNRKTYAVYTCTMTALRRLSIQCKMSRAWLFYAI